MEFLSMTKLETMLGLRIFTRNLAKNFSALLTSLKNKAEVLSPFLGKNLINVHVLQNT